MADIGADGLKAMSKLLDGYLKAVPALLGKTDVPDVLAAECGLWVGIVVDGVRCVVAMKDGAPHVMALEEVADGG